MADACAVIEAALAAQARRAIIVAALEARLRWEHPCPFAAERHEGRRWPVGATVPRCAVEQELQMNRA